MAEHTDLFAGRNHWLVHFAADNRGANRVIGGRHLLGKSHHRGLLYVDRFTTEYFTGAAKTGDDLVSPK